MFDSLKVISAAGRLAEENLYELVLDELARGVRRSGLWARALADSEGSEEKANALYMKYRVQSILDEHTLAKKHELNGDLVAAKKTEGRPDPGLAVWWAIVVVVMVIMFVSLIQ